MSFNPWALVIFLLVGMFLFGSQLTSTPILAVYFLCFVPAWLVGSMLWDWLRYRNKE